MIIDTIANPPILLDYEVDTNGLTLRLDKKGLFNFNDPEDAVEIIELESPDLTEVDLPWAREKVFEYEIDHENGIKRLICYINYAADEVVIPFASITVSQCSYEPSDLVIKGESLWRSYDAIWQRQYVESHSFYGFKNKLTFELKNEIARAQKKVDYYSEHSADEKAAAFAHQQKVLEKILRIVEENV